LAPFSIGAKEPIDRLNPLKEIAAYSLDAELLIDCPICNHGIVKARHGGLLLWLPIPRLLRKPAHSRCGIVNLWDHMRLLMVTCV
jgi:hypothetical protein